MNYSCQEMFTGGLGDVVGFLPKALARRGHRVMVVLLHFTSCGSRVLFLLLLTDMVIW
jgi:glycogen synthase